MRINNVGFLFLLFLVFTWSLAICGTVLAIKIVIPFIFFLKDGGEYLNFEAAIVYSIRAGLSSGIPLGIGIWFMSWMKVRKEKSPPPKEPPSNTD